MDWLGQVGNLVGKYKGGQDHPDAHGDFDSVAGAVPKDALASGLAAAFRSDRTPPFASLVGTLFRSAGGMERAGLMSILASAAGPALVQKIIGRPDARDAKPEDVEKLASEAEHADPGVVERLTGFVAENPALAKSLGGGFLGIAMSKLGGGGGGRDH